MTAPGYSAMAACLFPAKDEVFTPETEGHWICHTYGWKVSDKRGIGIVMFQLYFIRNIMPKYFSLCCFIMCPSILSPFYRHGLTSSIVSSGGTWDSAAGTVPQPTVGSILSLVITTLRGTTTHTPGVGVYM